MFVNNFNNYCAKFILRLRHNSFFEHYPFVKEIIKYSLVGNFSSLIDFSTYIYLTRFFIFWRENYLLANFFTMFIAGLFSFTFNKYWTFRNIDPSLHRQYFKFILISILGLAINQSILFVSVEYFALHDVLGKLIAILSSTLFIYYFVRTLVFKKEPLKFPKNIFLKIYKILIKK